MDKKFVTLKKIIDDNFLEIIFTAKEPENIHIYANDINRPALQLVGYFEHFDNNRIQVLGKAELAYIEEMDKAQRPVIFEKLCQTKIPAIIVARSMEIPPELIEAVKNHGVALLRSNDTTSGLMSSLIYYLSTALAPCITRHGVLVEVYGEGIFLTGDSGVGKSETAIELLKRGHRLIADDAVEIRRVSNKTLVGSAPEIIKYFIELRGIGIVDVRRLFGIGAVKETEKLNLVIEMEPWDETKQYDRLGLDDQFTDILGIKLPSLKIPVKPGRNLAVIIEVAAMNLRQKRLGYKAAEELNRRLEAQYK
ncbi:MAG: HPr(Ser) kinase/phosphatase [Ruminococcaceae bacterium]|nr:HPr(Ser) kinase/phosphatase [Oscillospiraceae bacterium]